VIKLDVALEGLDAVLAEFRALPKQVDRAEKRAVRKATRFLAAEVRRELAKAHGIPQKVLRQRKRIALKPNRGQVWVGTLPIAASHLGTPRQTRSGARVGRRRYDKAFVARMRSGHVGVFRRKGKSRLPIEEVREPLPLARAAADAALRKTESRLPVLFLQELNYEVNVRGTR